MVKRSTLAKNRARAVFEHPSGFDAVPNKASSSAHIQAQIVAAHGTHYVASVVTNGKTKNWHVVSRGKKNQAAVGDYVLLKETADHQAVIEAMGPRSNLLYRSDQYKSKMLAANVTQVCIVVAAEPAFADDMLSRALVALCAANVPAHLVLNKIDLLEKATYARQRLQSYAPLVDSVIEVSVKNETAHSAHILRTLFAGQTTLLIGQSGMGKSSLIAAVLPEREIATREISHALGTGRHTTTTTQLYALPQTEGSMESGAIIDSPGFSEFGLHHIADHEMAQAFREFAPHLGQCRFYNCMHLQEPGCGIVQALERGEIARARHDLYRQLVHESRQTVEGY